MIPVYNFLSTKGNGIENSSAFSTGAILGYSHWPAFSYTDYILFIIGTLNLRGILKVLQ